MRAPRREPSRNARSFALVSLRGRAVSQGTAAPDPMSLVLDPRVENDLAKAAGFSRASPT